MLSILVTTPVFSAPMTFNTLELLFAAVAYSVVIYADFSGYSDMAIGIALLLGFETPANFNRPYTAKSVTDFWKRWHISFSSWLRDYVYFAFGGSRFGIVRTMLALFFTMLIAGVWHGAKFTFLIWGAFQGLALCIERLFAKTYAEGEGQTLAQNLEVANIEEASLLEKAKTRHQKEGLKPRHSAKKYLHTAGTFLFITFSWIFFRSENLTEAGLYFASLRNLTLPFQVVSPLCVASRCRYRFSVYTRKYFRKAFRHLCKISACS